ncbi:MAG: hypothetical protein H6700_03625 [Myxococcales bacterium]|nr:hypothetical protein [Myxococcales bacterium]MCB9530831.1 hypothetical protein [Myxococcales bacterium]
MSDSIPTWWVDHGAQDAPEPTIGWVRQAYAVAEVLFSTAAGPPPPGRLRWMCSELRAHLDTVRGRSAWVVRASLLLMAWLGPLLVFRPPTLARLDFARRATALERWERSPLGLTLFAVKAMLCIVYFEHPEAAASLGFDGQCRGPDAGPPAPGGAAPALGAAEVAQ